MTRLSLRARLLLSMGSIVAVILIFSGAIDIWTGHRTRLSALRLRARLVATAQAAALANAVWEYDQDAAAAALEGSLQDWEFADAVVIDDTSAVFARVENKDVPAGDDPVVAKQAIELVAPGGERHALGSVEMRYSRYRLEERLRLALLWALGELVALVSVVTAGMALGLRFFARPIEEMTEVIHRRARGDLSLDVNPEYLSRADEIGAIAQSLEFDQQQRRDEVRLLEATSGVSAETPLDAFLRRLGDAGRELLGAERCEILLEEPKGDAGGPVLRVPLVTKTGARVGVFQAVNKAGRAFTERDELRVRSLAAQAAVALENARLLDEVRDEKAYSDSILSSLSDGVVSLDAQLRISTVNVAAEVLFHWREEEVRGKTLRELLPDPENDFEIDLVERVARTGEPAAAEDTDLRPPDGRLLTVNLNAVPLRNAKGESMGSLFVVEDITSEKRVRSTMARYLPGKVIDQLLAGDRAALGGTAQTVTSLFSDIRGFTTISEEIGARETVAMLNEYFTEMLEVLDQHNGVLDKFIGDAVMAIFGVPFAGAEDADNAVATANEMIRRLGRLNEVRRGRGQQPIKIGVGLNTGEVVAGNIGSPRRMSYTVIGDAVNLASRLEGATKIYGGAILMSEFTHGSLKDRRFLREVDVIRVKGRTQPVAVYESFAWREDRDADPVRRAVELSDAGVHAFRLRNWRAARKSFESLRSLDPRDALAAVYLERLANYQKAPPPDAWDGVWEMKSK